jgi:hypothetical protein
MNRALSLVAGVALIALGSNAGAQLPLPSLSVVGGVSHNNISVNNSPFGALRVDLPLVAFVGEASLGALRADEGTTKRTYIVPEVQLQYQVLPILIRPYVGVGTGWWRAMSGPDPKTNEMTYSASVGIRATVPLTGLGFRGEIRTRGMGGFHRRSTEYTVGVSF